MRMAILDWNYEKSRIFKKFEKNFRKKKIEDKDNLEKNGMDSLKILELMVFNDKNFKNIKISPDKISKCKTVGDLLKLYGREIN